MFTPFAFVKQEAAAAGPSYVTDGLQLYVDANVAASYPGTGTTWSDLSGGGRNLTIGNQGAWVNTGTSGFYYMDFVNGGSVNKAANRLVGGNLTPIPTGSNGISTVCMFAAWNSSTATYRTAIRDGNDANFLAIVNTNQNDLGTYTDNFYDGFFNVNDLPSYTTQFNYQVWEFHNTTAGSPYNQYWYQADLTNPQGTPITNVAAAMTAGPGSFGARQDGAQRALKIASILVYNKALTSAEKTQNYDYFKAQYGI